ncbi:MAG: transmembrane amino acid transporter protein-domain-containing protein [Monoraphidium minutum]|nr:MAG: transmembrane amino acid transporter protein-domain-containing protein [Monoraphidium minutum]
MDTCAPARAPQQRAQYCTAGDAEAVAEGAATAEELDHYAGHGAPAGDVKSGPLWRRVLWEGGTPVDGFLTAASAQVGQVILNLPNSMSKLSLAGGIAVQLGCAACAVYTLFLLVALYHEYKREEVRKGTWYNDGGKRRSRVTQYHTVITATTGSRALGEFARVVNIVELIGLAVAQIIASASNFYSLGTGLDKRSFTLIFGAVAMLMILVPSFRNMRAFTFLALAGTTYTAWFLIVSSLAHGLDASAAALPPPGAEAFFQGFSNIVFTFGGHCMLMELVDSQFRPSKFSSTFSSALAYVTLTLTLPSASLTFLAFPGEAAARGNAFAIFPASPAKSVGIVLMVCHQLVAFGLFILPVCTMWEKLVGTHYKSLAWRLPSRIPVGLFVLFLALLVPFFGVINDLLGAFAVTFETYIIPCVAWSLYFRTKERRAAAVIQPSRFIGGWTGAFVLNALVVLVMLVAGLGMGGYSSVIALIDAVSSFGVFSRCYNC